jgi:hypothetical protein
MDVISSRVLDFSGYLLSIFICIATINWSYFNILHSRHMVLWNYCT